ncbi:ankyrin repeat domain-containing protein 34B-like isoform X2 [Xiphophorus couchianus]|uniref:ankyrin repeat domain-containing protein 34B-like isoform X2 n=1 Tax=Xiphophorus couchianus TaxID=32473 RepID=UPI001016D677|nr:ankyrin repeat domain-containing protein 34B-like isoform X2 [Xiphophorus couchianus]
MDPLTDSRPLISAASCGKLRLLRLLVEGGAQVNGSNQRGETPLLAACKALREEPVGKESVKLLNFLLQNKADPNAQDQEGRTALMYACMQRAGALVASALVAAGADPCIEDGSGASALVYAINAQHQPTVQVLIDACRAKGRDIIIIATETGANRGPVTRRYLNVPPSPDSSPVSCMSPSDIILKTGSPSSPEGGNIFNFRGTSKHGSCSRRSSFELSQSSPCSGPASRQRVSSEPWLAINNLDSLKRAYEQGMRERNLKEEGGGDADVDEGMHFQRKDDVAHRLDAGFTGDVHKCWSEDSLSTKSDGGVPKRIPSPGGSDIKLSACSSPRFYLRRNTLPSVTAVNPPLHLPPLTTQPDSHLQVPAKVLPAGSRHVLFQPRPPCSCPPSSASARAALLPLLPQASSLFAPAGFSHRERSRRSLRRHSAQLEQNNLDF